MKYYMRAFAVILTLALVISMVQGAVLNTAATEIWAINYEPPTNLPAIFVELDDGFEQDWINQDTYISGDITVTGSEFSDILKARGAMKGRGNYSWSAPKKPYNIKFDNKTNLLGMGAAKKWVLIASYWDKTMLRNYITMEMARDVGLQYTTECKLVDLYVNGRYRGNYLLTEKIEIGAERVNVSEKGGGVLFEIEQPYRHGNGSACQLCHEVGSGTHLMYKEPELGDVTQAYIDKLMGDVNPFLDKLDASLSKGYAEYSKYIDVQSFVDWYIVNEFTWNHDSAFVTSCYCYYDTVTGKLAMGPVWDFDTCYGNQSPGTEEQYRVKDNAPWYYILMRDPDFVRMVNESWTQYYRDGTILNVLSNILDATDYAGDSMALNDVVWPQMLLDGGPRGWAQYITYKEEVDYLREFITKRTLWLNGEFNIDKNAPDTLMQEFLIICYGLLLDSTMYVDASYYVRASELMDNMTVEQRATIPQDIIDMMSDREVYLVEVIIDSLWDISSYSDKPRVDEARAMYEKLGADKKPLVRNYQFLEEAEERIIDFANELGIANVLRNNITPLVDTDTVRGPNGYAGESIDKIFDGSTGTKFCGWIGEAPADFYWDMKGPAKVTVYAIATANDSLERTPKSWVLYGSNDGENWNTVDTVTDFPHPTELYKYSEFFCDAPDEYLHYKLTVNEIFSSEILAFSEIMLGGDESEAISTFIDAVDAIGEVNVSKASLITAARALYAELTPGERGYVKVYHVKLLEAEILLITLLDDKDNINAVLNRIESFKNGVELSDDTAVKAAREAYENLSEAEKTFIPSENYAVLTNAEFRIKELKDELNDKTLAKAVMQKIDAFGEITSLNQSQSISDARESYNNLTQNQKGYVTNLTVLIAAEKALAYLDIVNTTIASIDALGASITHRSGTAVRNARSLYDSIKIADKPSVTNYDKLLGAEARLATLYNEYDIKVRKSSEDKSTFTQTPWMDFDNLSESELTATLNAMADEFSYQYKVKGYNIGVTNATYENRNTSGFFIIQNDMSIFDVQPPGLDVGAYIRDNSDAVGSPWGPSRYWSCVVAPYSGMSFSVTGYLAAQYEYQLPLSNSFEIGGYVFQVYSDGVRYHAKTPLVKGEGVAIFNSTLAPGSGDHENNGTFGYAYAKYSQENKWDSKVLGLPYGDTETTADGTIKYQRFHTEDGEAYIVGASAEIAAASINLGKPLGAYVITEELCDAFIGLGNTDEARFMVTGASLANATDADEFVSQRFENGYLIVYDNGSSTFSQELPNANDLEKIKKIANDIIALPEFGNMKATDLEKAKEIKAQVNELTTFEFGLLDTKLMLKLEKALTWTETVVTKSGDIDGNGVVEMRDLLMARDYILRIADLELYEQDIADINDDGKVNIIDIMRIRKLILA